MIRRTARIALEAVIGAIAVVALVAGLAVWRLTEGPVDLDFLTPRIESALSDPQTGVRVQVGVTQLTWEGWRRTLGLHVRQIRVRDANGALLAALPDVVMRLSLRALVRGVVAPTRVEVFGARISAVRRADGSLQFGPWEGALEGAEGAAGSAEGATEAATVGPGDNDFSRMMPDLLAELLKQPSVEDPLSFLRILRISGGSVRVDDRRLGLVWRAPFADIELRRDAEGLSGEMILKVDWRGRQMSLLALLDYGRASNQMDIIARFSDLPPEVIATLVPGLSAVGDLTMLFAGSVSVTMGLDGIMSGLDFDIRGGAGEFAAKDFFEQPVAVRSLRVTGQSSNQGRLLHLSDATIDLGTEDAPGPQVAVTGTIISAAQGMRGDLEIEAEASATGVAMANLGRYWPLGVAANPRAWITENIRNGTTEKATASIGLSVPDGKFDAAEVRQIEGTLTYDNLEIHYLRPLPPVTGVGGDATFDGDRFTFHTKGGQLGSLKIQDSTIGIAGLSLGREVMTIDLPVTGPLRDAMKVLDHDRLQLIRKLDLDPADIGGLMAARVGFKFPLLKDLTFDEMDVAASANLVDVALRGIFLGLDATEGQFTLSLDKAGMRLAGPLRLGGVPIEADWTETFTAKAAERTRIEAKVPRLDAADRDKFGLPLEPYLTGPISAHVIARRDRAGISTVQAAVNLQDATIDAAPLLWKKPAGAPGEATFALELVGNRLTRLSDFQVGAGGMSAKGSAAFDAAGTRVEKVDLTELVVNGSRLTNISVALKKDGIGVQVGGGILDATPWIEEASAPAPESRTATPSGASSTPLHLSAPKLNALLFGPERYLEGVSIDLVRNRGGWERIALNGSVPKKLWQSPKGGSGADVSGKTPKTLRVEFGPDPAGGTRFLAKAEDMGAALRALDALDTINGGQLEITGKSDGPLPYTPLTGRIEAKDFVMVGASGMAKLLTVASLTGIRDTLNGDGIRFQRLTGAYTLDDGVVHTDLLRAYGPAIGVTAKGEIDIDRAETKLQGTIVPAYTVNRILGGIPVLGPLLTGGEGEGVFAATYKVSGPLGDPQVDVNALSAIAPGFLRALFSSDAEPTALPPRTEP